MACRVTNLAVISDIHGNLPALDAVMAHLKKRKIKEICCAGDLTGYGPFPDQVVRRIRERNIPCVIGNYDRKVLRYPEKKAGWKTRKHPLKLLAFGWAHQHLSEESLDYLAALPKRLEMRLAGRRILVRHSLRLLSGEWVSPGSRPSQLARLAGKLGTDVVVFGHTHRPFAVEAGGTWFVNAGSVGRPEGDTRAGYVLIRFFKRSVRVRIEQVPYDIARTRSAILDAGLPEDFCTMFETGTPLLPVCKQRSGA